jgi:hypothetical protein
MMLGRFRILKEFSAKDSGKGILPVKNLMPSEKLDRLEARPTINSFAS